jgi:hypothetical protein
MLELLRVISVIFRGIQNMLGIDSRAVQKANNNENIASFFVPGMK